MHRNSNDYFHKEIAPYYTAIYRYLLRLGCEENLAEDMSQEVMEAAWKNIDHLMEIDYDKSWLFTVAKNKYYSYARLVFHKYEYTDADFLLSDYECSKIQEDISNFIIAQESTEIIEKALDLIDDKYSDLIRMRYFGELTHHEISEKLLLNENTVRSTVSRGLKILKEVLTKLGYMKEED